MVRPEPQQREADHEAEDPYGDDDVVVDEHVLVRVRARARARVRVRVRAG